MPGAVISFGVSNRGGRWRPADSVLAKRGCLCHYGQSEPLALETLAGGNQVEVRISERCSLDAFGVDQPNLAANQIGADLVSRGNHRYA